MPGVPAQAAGVFNQNITGAQAGTTWAQALNVWTTPWGFLKAAAGRKAHGARQGGLQVVSFSPANLKSPSGQAYTVTGYINAQNLVTKVETRVDHPVVGDLPVEFEYSNYRNMNGVQVPGRIVQRQAGMQTFDASIDVGDAEPAQPRRVPDTAAPARRARRPPAPPAAAASSPPVEKLGEGVFKIGGNYTSLAIDMGTTSSSSRAARTTRVVLRSWRRPGRPFPKSRSDSWSIHTRTSITPAGSARR